MKHKKRRSISPYHHLCNKTDVVDCNMIPQGRNSAAYMYLAPRHNRIAHVCGRKGVISRTEIARLCRVTTGTVANWFKFVPAFRKAYLQGIDEASIDVEQALVKRAKGYNQKIKEVRIEHGGVAGVRKIITKKVIHVAGDVAAQKFFLRNRKSKRWNVDKGIITKSMNLDIHLDASDKDA